MASLDSVNAGVAGSRGRASNAVASSGMSRFAAMMAAHHQHAIEMAKIQVASGTHPELVALAPKHIAP